MGRDYLDVSIADGKYRVIFNDNKFEALRYNEEWRDLTGDNLIYFLTVELQEAREKIESAKNCLVCSAIAPSIEVIQNTLNILEDKNV